MKQIRTARELYCELVKAFYFGVYQKGERLMTYQELHDTYGLAKNTIGRTFEMLQQDEFILTEGPYGTVVTFDIHNPEHVALVPLEWPSAKPEDTIPYEVAMRLHAHSLFTGLTHSDEVQLQACEELVSDILRRVNAGVSYNEQVLAFWKCTISSLDNQILNRITDHFISRYLYLLPPTHLSDEQKQLITQSAQEYYIFLLDAIAHRDFTGFTARFEQHYHNYYRYGGVVFAKTEDGTVFKEQALYGKLLKDLCIQIMSGELQIGDSLPTTRRLCADYGISTTTVNRAYGILTEMGFIRRYARSGTRLIADPNNAQIWHTLEKTAGLHRQDWLDAIDILIIIIGTLGRRIILSPKVVHQMRTELARQHEACTTYSAPYFVATVLISPIIASLPAGIIHKYYTYLTDILSKGIAMCTFRVHGNDEHAEVIYQLMCEIIEALESGDQSMFAAGCEHVLLRNAELLNADYESAVKTFGGNIN